MSGARGLLLLGLPLLAALGVVCALSFRAVPERASLRPVPHKVSRAADMPQTLEDPLPSLVPPAKDVPTAVSNSRIRTTLLNYRAALADKNEALQRALLPVLRRDLETARLYAQDDLARAESEPERAAARRTLEALER